MSKTQLGQLLANQPPEIQDEIIRINTDSRPLALQVALLFNSFRMMACGSAPRTAANGCVS